MALHPKAGEVLAAQALQLVALIRIEGFINPFPLDAELIAQADAVARIARQLLAGQEHDRPGPARFAFDPPEGGGT